MADPIGRTVLFEINRIRLKLITRGFLGSLTTNLILDFRKTLQFILDIV